ncbi:MAG: HAD family hydrolase [Planctomycetota bacterium]|jgi:HAD superfamily hydrolase (TIGR01509 family)
MGARHSSAVFFDLDDTLIDTRQRLLPAALQRVADATGIALERLDATGKRIEEVLRNVSGLTPAQRDAAKAAWYVPLVPALEPLPGAREVLDELSGRLLLVLVTRGHPARQRRKIERCGLGPCFDEIIIRPFEAAGSKRDDFARVMDAHGLTPERCAVVGDDERDELKHAGDLGCLVLRVPDVALADVPQRLREAGIL